VPSLSTLALISARLLLDPHPSPFLPFTFYLLPSEKGWHFLAQEGLIN
jgi:hypothetical protein